MTTSSAEIRHHLDEAADKGYLDAINGTTPESLVDAQSKVRGLWDAVGYEAGMRVLSIGVGQGEELHALKSLNPLADVLGVDLSREALNRTQRRGELYDLDLKVVNGDARQIPFSDESIGAIVMSAVIHEIYSYCEPGGLESVGAAINDATRVLSRGGILYVREFGSPREHVATRLAPRSDIAQAFYDHFVVNFGAGINSAVKRDAITIDENGMLPVASDLTQILLHFRNFWNDMTKGVTNLDDENWKESSESYVLQDKQSPNGYIDPNQLIERIPRFVDSANGQLTLIDFQLLPRRKANLFLAQHFTIYDQGGADITQRMLPQVTEKIEALFRKTA